MALRFSPEAEKRFGEILGRYPRKEAALLPVLWMAQNEFGHLSREVQSYVANRLSLSLAKVESVVSFYTLYNTEPKGKHHVQICRNISCRLKGSEELTACMEKSPSDEIGFSNVECLAACGGAPVIRVDDDYYEKATPKDLERVVGKIRGSGGENR